MSPAIAAPRRGQLERRIDVAVIEVPGLVVTDRLAAAAAENLLAAPDALPATGDDGADASGRSARGAGDSLPGASVAPYRSRFGGNSPQLCYREASRKIPLNRGETPGRVGGSKGHLSKNRLL